MKELVDIGGIGFIIPVVLGLVVLHLARGLFGVHGRRHQSRKEFLELWDEIRAHDDLWLETIVRHLTGTYLPAHVIRLALSCPDKVQSLLDLAELWPLLRYNREARTVTWLHARHLDVEKRKRGRWMLYIGYFICAIAAFLEAVYAAEKGPDTVSGWVFGIAAVVFAAIAIIFLLRDDTMKVAVTVGDEWINRINASVAPQGTRSPDGTPDSGVAPR